MVETCRQSGSQLLSKKKSCISSSLGVTFLIAGCCLGVGMLGLPVVSSSAGFFPSLFGMLICYLFATATGLLLLEAILWFDRRVHLISIAKEIIGKPAGVAAWTLFLFLFYCLFVAYLDGGGQLLASAFSALLKTHIPVQIGILVCAIFVGTIVYLGASLTCTLSRLFLGCLLFCYFALIILGVSHVEISGLFYKKWTAVLPALPIFLICFGYQNLIPSIVEIANRNIKSLRFAILMGNLIPFFIYAFWNFIILGMAPPPYGETSMVTELLKRIFQSGTIYMVANAFSLFAILTPFLGSALAFVDFFRDGLRVPNSRRGKIVICLLVFMPPVLFTLLCPHLFLQMLKLIGGFVDVLLFGVLPSLIVWMGRYVEKREGPYRVAGGKWLIGSVLLFSLMALWISSSGLF